MAFRRYTRMAIVCPIVNQRKDDPMRVKLDVRTKTPGEILCEHVKSLDLTAHRIVFIERLPDELLEEALERMRLSVE